MRHITTNNTPTPTMRGIADHSWQERGRCHGLPAKEIDELFFHAARDRAAIDAAKAICGSCPVKKACFDYALDNEIRQGLWGGLTEDERRPWHARVNKRLDYARVKAAFEGRDVHLSDAEREAVTRHAYVRGWSPERLAYALRLDNLDWARDLMRNAAHAVADRDRYWGQAEPEEATADENAKAEDTSEEDTEDATSPVQVPRQAQTHALIAALRKAA
ncbi:WhiB family transcriptional regulator [Streptomyces sp. SID13726]|uniref:WhiB family transcriptional regulator n=1 Tax=Streptomyces sp. SID13726 TaxID=2706058 RepID=UPI0013BDF5A6|nr:WhiB family transcriptional regulator [Streptomyces sp. SID13726]NEB01914.1 WhiB family transcriptional regulator [Streptomyces sp. SID13726]